MQAELNYDKNLNVTDTLKEYFAHLESHIGVDLLHLDMGRQTYKESKSVHHFVRNVLEDIEAMEYMLAHDWFESDITRIGAEQEIVLIDRHTYRPSLMGPEILSEAQDADWLVAELARFNLELNLSPQVFEGKCFTRMEDELRGYLSELRSYLHPHGIDYLLTGILPTLHKYHLAEENLTPIQRYYDLMDAIRGQLQTKSFELRLVGIDELLVRHDTALLEACNTSFQVHLQVSPEEFVPYYNNALALCAPCISLAANSPIVFGKRLWHETRIALFQQAIDTRKSLDHMRQMSPRVTLGENWLDGDVTNILKDDIARFRVLLHADMGEGSMSKIRKGHVPKLKSAQLFNSTVYRWNRPCYGISDNGKPHLRIENRVIPSGPTVLDEMANTAFWLGAMKGMALRYDDIRQHMSFADVRDNFAKSARFGLDTKLNWTGDVKVSAEDLIIQELLPMSKEGLMHMNVAAEDINRYIGTIEERVKANMNGARWMLRTYTSLRQDASSVDEALTSLTASIYDQQNREEHPVHNWPEAEVKLKNKYDVDQLRVSELMVVDLFSAHKNDPVELVTKLMTWKDISHMPVENKNQKLVGLISAKSVLSKLMEEKKKKKPRNLLVKDVMDKNPATIDPTATLKEVSRLMQDQNVSCVPVVKNGELIGLVTHDDIVKITNRLLSIN